MARIDQRAALDVLTKPRLLALATFFGIGLGSGSRKAELVEALASSTRASFPRILELLRRDELKAICRAAGIDDKGREKAAIAGRLLRHGFEHQRDAMPREELKTLTKAELAYDVAEVTELRQRQAETIVSAVLESLTEALHKGSRIEVRGFGSFGVRHRDPYTARNPRTGAKVNVPARRIAFFKPGKALRRLLNA